MTETVLPQAFADLLPFVETWDQPDFNSRYAVRLGSSFAALQAFHDAMMPRGEAILAHLDGKPLDNLDEADRRLGRLMYALAIVAQAVEVFKQVRVPDTEATNLTLTAEFKL